MFGFSIKEILPHIYHLNFESAYDNAMHFFRFQEYYESPKFHKKIFAWVDYMEWYAEKHGKGGFTYASDWGGFNVPSWVLHQVRIADIPDPNRYDRFMFNLIDWVELQEHPHDYYFIGTSTKRETDKKSNVHVLDHEIAHALYTVNPEYRTEVAKLFREWDQGPKHKGEELSSAMDVLRGMGYHESTILDEVHAYSATGLSKDLKGVISNKERKPFQKLFREFEKKCREEASK